METLLPRENGLGGNSNQKGALAMRLPHVDTAAPRMTEPASREAATSPVVSSDGHDRTSLRSILSGRTGALTAGVDSSIEGAAVGTTDVG